MIPIDMNTVGVQSEAELRSAVADVNINYIYLAENITITAGITILASKAALVIDGEYPQESGIIHRLTDVNSTSYDQTLGIRGSSSIALTFRNMTIFGRNYYGVPYILESGLFVDTSGVSVTYENVDYSGPQITYNRNGRTRYVDCDISIVTNGASPAEEVGEVNRVEFGGTTNIRHTATDDAVFWFNNLTSTSSLTVLSGATVQIISDSSYFMYNLNGLIRVPVSYTLQPGASLSLQVSKGISHADSHPVSSFLVDAGASFYYVQTASNDNWASIYVDGALEVRQGARFYMEAANGTQPLIRFSSGANRSLTVNNPLSFVLYSPNAAAVAALGTVALTLRGGQINTWSTAKTPRDTAGGFDDQPLHKWFKRDYAQPAQFIGTLNVGVTAGTTNMEADDEPHPLDSDMSLASTRVLSIGDWTVNMDPVADDGRPITGETEPGANLIVEYDIDEVEHSIEGAAEEDGSFSISTSLEEPPTIPEGTQVVIWSNIPFLIKRQTATAVFVGVLSIISAPDQIVFRPRPIAYGPPLLPRMPLLERLMVGDTRVDGTRWELLASISGPLRAESGEVLTDALVYVETEGASPETLSAEPIVIYTGGPYVTETDIDWAEREGILVRVTDPIRSGVTYTTYILWEVRAI